jgi:hypothetical protein
MKSGWHPEAGACRYGHGSAEVRAASDRIKATETIPGVVTLGKIVKDPNIYIVDASIESKVSRLPT